MLVVIPAHNEAETINDVIVSLKRFIDGTEIVVVDDASSDDTAALARAAGASVLPLPIQLGAWGATQAGMRYALRNDHAAIVTMDGDGQHPANRVSALISALHEEKADVVIGACVGRGSPARRLAWWLFKRLTGLRVEDLTSGFRAYNRRAIEVLASPEATLLDYQDIGVLMLLRSAGLHISEIDVPMNTRRTGRSRIFHSWLAIGYYLAHTTTLCLAKWTPSQSANRHDTDPLRTK